MPCLKCGSDAVVKNGFMKGAQRYKCKNCSYQFTKDIPRGKPVQDKILALTLYTSGASMNMIGHMLGVSTQTIMRWVRSFYLQYADLPEPRGRMDCVNSKELAALLAGPDTEGKADRHAVFRRDMGPEHEVLFVVRKKV